MDERLSRLAAGLTAAPRLLRLRPAVQPYAWGGYDFIAGLLGEANDARLPRAELWIGAHPVAPASALAPDGEVSLAALCERAGPAVVGEEAVSRFGRTLPYLLKILDVRTMLSIQAHPDAAQAREGYEREERAGIPRTAPGRNYRDPSHKPEAAVALTDFWMLFGFRDVGAIAATLGEVPELERAFRAAGVHPPAETEGEGAREWLRSAYAGLMRLPQPAIDETLGPLADRLNREDARSAFDRSTPEFWAVRASREFRPAQGRVDRGLASIFLLNLVRLKPRQGVFVPAGVLHAYLEGVAVEIMAASDNVLRGGLTPKHVDLDELLRIVRCACTTPRPIAPLADATGEQVYPTPAAEFRLGWLELAAGERFAPGAVRGADALLVIEGEAAVLASGDSVTASRGACLLATSGLDYTVVAPERAVLVRASVPRSPR